MPTSSERPGLEPVPHVCVCGTRTLARYSLVEDKLNELTADLGQLVVVTGEWRGIGFGTPGYVGADLLAEMWADRRHYKRLRFPPPFGDHQNTPAGRAGAFHQRNREMVAFVATEPLGFGVAFWDGVSPGTASVIELFKKHKVRHRVVRYQEES